MVVIEYDTSENLLVSIDHRLEFLRLQHFQQQYKFGAFQSERAEMQIRASMAYFSDGEIVNTKFFCK